MRRLALAVLLVALAPLASAQSDFEQLDDLLGRYAEAGQLHGTVLAAQGDDVLYEAAFGEANREWDIPNTPETRFRIASVTKQFTAALVLQLAEDGLLDLDAPISTYLPDYPEAQAGVTTHQLLNHTSGIPSYTSLPGFMQNDTRDPYTPTEFLSFFSDLPLEFEPGTEFSYNNSGYFLLGLLVETVMGVPYDEALQARLFDPLGLGDSGYDHTTAIIERRAQGYERTGRSYRHAPYLDSSIPYAAGMMYSTVGDLHAWTQALHGGEVFESAETLDAMTTPGMGSYGYGLFVSDREMGDAEVRMIAHSGGIPGFNTQLWYLPETDHTIAVLDNGGGNSGTVAEVVARALIGQPTPEPVISIAEPVAEAIDAEGIDAGIALYRELKASQPDAYDFGENELNGLGYQYLGDGDLDTAIRIFQLNVEMFPEASNPYDSLGEAYLEAGNRDLAIVNYQKALELNPNTQTAIDALREMGVEVEEPEITLSPDVLAGYVGTYEIQPSFVIDVTTEGGQLFAQATGQQRFEVFPASEDRFYLKVVDAQITFNRDEAGAVESLTLHQGGQNVPAPKVE
ncbi:MAG: serine hydrolase [Bacteroidota bacterium]